MRVTLAVLAVAVIYIALVVEQRGIVQVDGIAVSRYIIGEAATFSVVLCSDSILSHNSPCFTNAKQGRSNHEMHVRELLRHIFLQRRHILCSFPLRSYAHLLQLPHHPYSLRDMLNMYMLYNLHLRK